MERSHDRPILVIQLELIEEDINYFTNHALTCKFMGIQVPLLSLESWAHQTWSLEDEMEVMMLEITILWWFSSV